MGGPLAVNGLVGLDDAGPEGALAPQRPPIRRRSGQVPEPLEDDDVPADGARLVGEGEEPLVPVDDPALAFEGCVLRAAPPVAHSPVFSLRICRVKVSRTNPFAGLVLQRVCARTTLAVWPTTPQLRRRASHA